MVYNLPTNVVKPMRLAAKPTEQSSITMIFIMRFSFFTIRTASIYRVPTALLLDEFVLLAQALAYPRLPQYPFSQKELN